MRIALLSALETTEAGDRRAFETFGGRTLIAWQADIAHQLGCERIICIAPELAPELIELQREVESSGGQFQLIRGPLQLVGLASADQELIVLSDGLIIDPELALQIAGQGKCVAALPSDEGIAAGFERIDVDRSWGGLFIARANIVEKLAEMPPDSDTVSALLRLALQSGTKIVPIDKLQLSSGNLILSTDSAALSKRETSILDRAAAASPWTAPGLAFADRLARKLSPNALKNGPLIALGIAGVAGLGAIRLAAANYSWPALIFAAFCALAMAVSNAFLRLRSRLWPSQKNAKYYHITNALVDILLIMILALPTTISMLPNRLFLPVLLIGHLRLAQHFLAPSIAVAFSDRVLLALLLVPAAWFGVQDQTMAALSLMILSMLLLSSRQTQITGD